MGLGAKGFGVLRSRMVKLENQLHKEQEEAKKKGSSKKGKTFFTFGGAASHDIRDGILEMSDKRISYWDLLGKECRINHLTWWEREIASREEMDEGLHNLEKAGNKVDFILTHCINTSTAALMSSGRYKPDSMTEYLEKIYGTVESLINEFVTEHL